VEVEVEVEVEMHKFPNYFSKHLNKMDYFLTLEHWTSIVRKIKDEELEYEISAYKTGQLAKDILTTIRSSRFRQAVLFREKRGEEYERFVTKLNVIYDPEAVKRILDNDEFWEACFSLRSS
jgi:hypothetical protein